MAATPRTARYLSIAADLRAKIADGTFPVDSPLPSMAMLRAEYAVSGTVVQRALSELKHEGLVQGQPGKAVYVIDEPDASQLRGEEYIELMRQIESLKTTVDDVFTNLDQRVSELEKTTRHRRSPRAGS